MNNSVECMFSYATWVKPEDVLGPPPPIHFPPNVSVTSYTLISKYHVPFFCMNNLNSFQSVLLRSDYRFAILTHSDRINCKIILPCLNMYS